MSIDGKFTPVDAGSICVHGDSPGALEMAKQVRAVLEKQGIEIYGFTHKGDHE